MHGKFPEAHNIQLEKAIFPALLRRKDFSSGERRASVSHHSTDDLCCDATHIHLGQSSEHPTTASPLALASAVTVRRIICDAPCVATQHRSSQHRASVL
jgi:hypothetical protein